MNDWIPVKSNFFTSTEKNKNYDLRYNKSTGAFEIRERDNSGNYVGDNIYENGNWNRGVLDIPELIEYSPTDVEKKVPIQTDTAKRLNREARDLTNKAYENGGYKNRENPLNQAAKESNKEAQIGNQSSGSASSGISTATAETGLFGSLGPLEVFPEVPNPSLNIGNLLYPIDLLETQQDNLEITQIVYQSPYKDIFINGQTPQSIIQNGLIRGSVKRQELKGSVILPMPNSPQDSNNVEWGGDSMDAVTSQITSNVSTKLAPSTALNTAAGIAELFGFPGATNVTKNAILLAVLVKAMTGDPESQAAAKSALASYNLSRFGFEVSPESILARGFGVVPNSNIQLLFNNVSLRGFSFNYILSPRSEKEAIRINQILRWFKQGMAAKKRTLKGGSALLLGTPNVFQLKYRSGRKDIKGINKFKVCALTQFNVNYSPGGQWAAFKDGQPSAVAISMSFKELDPIYDTDYTPNPQANSDNLPVADDEIGY